ncbi:MAG: HAD hydrolase-like protein, partial [Bacilli bacterium]|nr:HAD hydrolase-like protein [Bacilli bacterium]
MKIGIDLDGVLFDSEKFYRVYAELYDEQILKRNSKVDNKEVRFQERFNWSVEEQKDFIDRYLEKVFKEANFMPGAIEVLKLLKTLGCKLVVVTARGGMGADGSANAIDITKKRFEEANLDIFDKCLWGAKDKAQLCKNEGIDVMIDDNIGNCKMVSNAHIKT